MDLLPFSLKILEALAAASALGERPMTSAAPFSTRKEPVWLDFGVEERVEELLGFPGEPRDHLIPRNLGATCLP
jgi:hypothetical protein